MPQTTSSVGRSQIAFPDRGYDAQIDGGVALHAALTTTIKGLSDNLTGRWFDSISLSSSSSTNLVHNFGLALSSIKVLIMESGVLKTQAEVSTRYTISQISTSTIKITNISGGSITGIQVYILGYPLGVKSADIDASIDATVNRLAFTGGIILSNMAEPSSPSASKLAVYVDTADGKLKAKDSAGTVSVYATSVGSFTTGNVSANDSNVTFTSSSNRFQTSNPTAARNHTLPTTGISAGEVWEFVNRATVDGNVITYLASGGSPVAKCYPTGKLKLQALISSPTLDTDWLVVSNTSNWISYTPTAGAGFGTITNSSGFYRIKDNTEAEFRGGFTSGTTAAAIASISLPSTITLNSNYLTRNTSTTSNTGNIVGTFGCNGAGNFSYLVTAPGTSTTDIYVATNMNTSSNMTPTNGNNIATSASLITFQFSIPI